MRNWRSYAIWASSTCGRRGNHRPVGRSQDALRFRRVMLFPGVATLLLATIANAQAAKDVFACAKPGVSVGELENHFAGLGWVAETPDRADVLRQAIFLGNVDSAKPLTWVVTANWAARLAKAPSDATYQTYAQRKSAVLIGTRDDGAITCILVSDKQLDRMFQGAFPQLKLSAVENRKFGWFDLSSIKVSAAFLDPVAIELANLADGRISTATIVNKTASAVEDWQ